MTLAEPRGPERFEAAVQEFKDATRALLGLESLEDRPPPEPAPLRQHGPPYQSALLLDESTLRRYADSVGEDNPLYADPAYGPATRYGSPLAPGPIVSLARYPLDHGATRPGGFPVANYAAGVAFEFFDVIRPGPSLPTSKVPHEFFEKQGAIGPVLYLGAQTSYWAAGGALLARAYGSLALVPMRSMESGRVIDPARLGEQMLYRGQPHQYTPAEASELCRMIDNEQRRGRQARWWEEVTLGDDLPPIVQPPYTVHDSMTYQWMRHALTASIDGGRLLRAFGPAYRRGREQPDFARTHPVTRWPFTPGEWDEHYDVYLAPYRGVPLPFDFGIHRIQVSYRILSNWMGDDGFVRRLYLAFRRPIFYGDVDILRGRVVKKYRVVERGPETASRYGAVAVSLDGTNQRGERHSEGFATVYLPSRECGLPSLPVPHHPDPPYVPVRQARALDWY